MLTADELASIQATQAAALPETATIRRATSDSDGLGKLTKTWADVATGVACRAVRPRTPQLALTVAGESVLADWIVTLAAGTDAQTQDEIVVGGRTLVVVGQLQGPWNTALRLACVERT